MSFLYPRLVSVHRQKAQTAGGGVKPYSGETPTNEDVIATGLPASIQFKRERSRPDAGLPTDSFSRGGWNILIPKSAAALGLIVERDVIVDDLGKRYQVVAPYWNSLGYNLSADVLQA